MGCVFSEEGGSRLVGRGICKWAAREKQNVIVIVTRENKFAIPRLAYGSSVLHFRAESAWSYTATHIPLQSVILITPQVHGQIFQVQYKI